MRPTREKLRGSDEAYFISTQTAERKPLFRHTRWAQSMVATIRHYARENFTLHAFVVMPDHLHLLITPLSTVEKAVQLIKGGFSFRARRELGWSGEIWQPGFTDHRIRDEADWNRHLEYIRSNPVDARLTEDSILYEFMGFPDVEFPQRLKPTRLGGEDVRAKARTLHTEARTLQAEARTLHTEARKSKIEASTLYAEARTLQAEARTLQSNIRED
jgi:putative transposase